MINTSSLTSYFYGLACTCLLGLACGVVMALVAKREAARRGFRKGSQRAIARGTLTLSVFLPSLLYWKIVTP